MPHLDAIQKKLFDDHDAPLIYSHISVKHNVYEKAMRPLFVKKWTEVLQVLI